MAYTEIKKRNKRKYYYRVISVRKRNKVAKKRKYLGVNLCAKELKRKEKEADKKLGIKNKKIKRSTLEKIKPKIIKILKKNKIKKAGIFGSYVRGEQKRNSDIDILAEVPKKVSLFDFVGIKLELEDALGRKVDLVEYCAIKPLIKEKILNEEVRIL